MVSAILFLVCFLVGLVYPIMTYRILYLQNKIVSVAPAYSNTTLKNGKKHHYYFLNGSIYYSLVKAKDRNEAVIKGQEILDKFLKQRELRLKTH